MEPSHNKNRENRGGGLSSKSPAGKAGDCQEPETDYKTGDGAGDRNPEFGFRVRRLRLDLRDPSESK